MCKRHVGCRYLLILSYARVKVKINQQGTRYSVHDLVDLIHIIEVYDVCIMHNNYYLFKIVFFNVQVVVVSW